MKLASLALAAALCLAPFARAEETEGVPVPQTVTTRITYTATVPEVPEGTRALDLWIPLPSDSRWQTITDVKVESPVPHRITRERQYGNRMIYLRAEGPKTPLSVTVSFVVQRKPTQVLAAATPSPVTADAALPSPSRLLAADRLVPVSGRFSDIAKEVAGLRETPRQKMRAIFDHVVATMQYDYDKESPKLGQGDVAFVCDYKKGNCSDLHSYLISLARSQGIPAYLEYGFPVGGIPLQNPLPSSGAIGGYHCWTWFRDPEAGWVPLDASDARRWLDSKRPAVKDHLFGNLITQRSTVAFSRGRDLTLEPAQKGGPLNYFIYPYAEADGKAAEAKWEVKYQLVSERADAAPSPESLQQQIEELRTLVEAQQAELRDLRAALEREKPAPGAPGAAPPPAGAATASAPSPAPATAASGSRLSFYGFLRLDTIYDSQATNNSQTPFFVRSPGDPNVGRSGNGVLAMHPRLTRLGINYAPPAGVPGGVTGKLELDWQNASGVTPESRPVPRIRHAYLQWQRGAHTLLFGQTWDVISPLLPSPNDDTLMWNVGNLGDRRPQIRYAYAPRESPVTAALALGLTSAVDNKDLDGNGIRDGEDSALPNVQARLAWAGRRGSIGVWGHYAVEETAKPQAGRSHFASHSVGLDWQWRAGERWDLRGEVWTGQNLSDVRGGIGQGVNLAAGHPIHSTGGWAELGYQPKPRYRVAVGYTLDDPQNGDVPAGGRTHNRAAYLHNRWRLTPALEMGFNYLYWTTDWAGMPGGIDHRLNWFVQHNF